MSELAANASSVGHDRAALPISTPTSSPSSNHLHSSSIPAYSPSATSARIEDSRNLIPHAGQGSQKSLPRDLFSVIPPRRFKILRLKLCPDRLGLKFKRGDFIRKVNAEGKNNRAAANSLEENSVNRFYTSFVHSFNRTTSNTFIPRGSLPFDFIANIFARERFSRSARWSRSIPRGVRFFPKSTTVFSTSTYFRGLACQTREPIRRGRWEYCASSACHVAGASQLAHCRGNYPFRAFRVLERRRVPVRSPCPGAIQSPLFFRGDRRSARLKSP